jgi:hypothetical protein
MKALLIAGIILAQTYCPNGTIPGTYYCNPSPIQQPVQPFGTPTNNIYRGI